MPSAERAHESADDATCTAILRRGSKSFHAASLLLPARLRPAITAFYAYCRIADDAIDLAAERGHVQGEALAALHRDLDGLYAGAPPDHPVYRALGRVVRRYDLPRPLFAALLEGFDWDVEGRRYETLAAVRAYAARVAGAVGVAMTLLMERRAPATLARGADLGVAMQLTNIARDVGEDARAGRIYLPLEWLHEVGVDPEELLRSPRFSPALGSVIERLLAEAKALYLRADPGIRELPADCRIAIGAARLLYADIGRSIRRAGYDSVSVRHGTTTLRKIVLLSRALRAIVPRPARASAAAPLDETRFLVEAVTS